MVNSASYRVLTPTLCGTSYRGFSARSSPFPDATHNVFCRKLYYADRLCPRLFTTLYSHSISHLISSTGTTSCSIHTTTRFRISSYFGFLQRYGCTYPQQISLFLQSTTHLPRLGKTLLSRSMHPYLLCLRLKELTRHICVGRLSVHDYKTTCRRLCARLHVIYSRYFKVHISIVESRSLFRA